MRVRLFLFLLMVPLVLATASGKDFPDLNFAIDQPEGWTEAPIPSGPTLFAWNSADGSRAVIGVVSKLPAKEFQVGAQDFRVGMKDALKEKGCEISDEREIRVRNQPFILFSGKYGNGSSVAVYTAAAGDVIYSFQAILREGDAEKDPALRAAIGTFRLLKPAANLPLNGPPTAYKSGQALGKVLAFYSFAKLPAFVARVVKLLWI